MINTKPLYEKDGSKITIRRGPVDIISCFMQNYR